MIADKLAELARAAQEEQHKVHRRSEKARVAEEFGQKALDLFLEPNDATGTEKILAFDALREMLIQNLVHATRSGIRGNGFREDKDHDHYVYEEAMKLCLGKDIFVGYNVLSRMLGEVG